MTPAPNARVKKDDLEVLNMAAIQGEDYVLVLQMEIIELLIFG